MDIKRRREGPWGSHRDSVGVVKISRVKRKKSVCESLNMYIAGLCVI